MTGFIRVFSNSASERASERKTVGPFTSQQTTDVLKVIAGKWRLCNLSYKQSPRERFRIKMTNSFCLQTKMSSVKVLQTLTLVNVEVSGL